MAPARIHLRRLETIFQNVHWPYVHRLGISIIYPDAFRDREQKSLLKRISSSGKHLWKLSEFTKLPFFETVQWRSLDKGPLLKVQCWIKYLDWQFIKINLFLNKSAVCLVFNSPVKLLFSDRFDPVILFLYRIITLNYSLANKFK